MFLSPALSQKLRAVKSSHDQLLREMETQNDYLKQEQTRVLTLQNELKQGTANQRRIMEVSGGLCFKTAIQRKVFVWSGRSFRNGKSAMRIE